LNNYYYCYNLKGNNINNGAFIFLYSKIKFINMRSIALLLCFFVLNGLAMAQAKKPAENPYVLLGQKALLDGDFKTAVSHLEKALPAEANNPDVQYMLGYSYYHSAAYANAISSFTKVIALRPQKPDAYYYRGKARNTLGTQMKSTLSPSEREKLIKAAIDDFTKGIELNKEQGVEYYQNRALANRDYAILRGERSLNVYDKTAAENAYKASLVDLQRIIDQNPSRKDIADEIKKVKVYMANLK
jgi:tetratricopeptide (TPR) repeat protein